MKKILILISCFVLTFSGAAWAKTIMIIESYHAEYPWDASYVAGIKEIVGDSHKILTFEMDTKRVPADQYEQKAQEAWLEYQKIRPDLVILGDDNALKFLGPKFAQTEIPVIYLGINRNPKDYGIVGKKNITGVLERPLFKRSVVFIKKILSPVPKKIMILFDSGETSKAAVSEVFKGQSIFPIHMVPVHLKLIGDLTTWKQTVLNAKKDGYDAMVIGLYHTLVDDAGKHVNAETLLKWTSENAPVPPFCFWDFTVKKEGAIGGLVLFGKTQGVAAGKMALRIFSGESPHKIKVEIPETGRVFYSKTQLEKWNITLPKRIAFRAEYAE